MPTLNNKPNFFPGNDNNKFVDGLGSDGNETVLILASISFFVLLLIF